MLFSSAFRAKMTDDLVTFTESRFPLPMRNEWGEGQERGLPNKDRPLSHTFSSIVPLKEEEQAPIAFNKESVSHLRRKLRRICFDKSGARS